MSDGLKLLSSAIAHDSPSAITRLDADLFLDNERTALDFIRGHYRSYRALPSAQTVQSELGIRLPVANEPLQFYIDSVTDRYAYNQMAEHYQTMRQQLSNRNMGEVAETVRQMGIAMRGRQRAGEVVGMGEALGEVINRLDSTRGYGGITGIPAGWDGFDELTGGFQNSDLVTVVGRPSLGKCMHPDTPVVKHNGRVVKIRELKVGDKLMGPDSQPRTVLSTTTGVDPMYRISPVRGEDWICNQSHILVLRCNKDLDKVHAKGSMHLYSVGQFLALPGRVRRTLRLVRTGVEFPEKEVEFSPYVIGAWLGDGTVGFPRFSTIDPEMVQSITEFAHNHGMTVTQYEYREGACPYYGVVGRKGVENEFKRYLNRDCYVDGQKRVPALYLYNSREVRLQALAGLIDTDGYLGGDGKIFEFTTKYPGLRDDVLYLARSLGLGASYAVKVVNGAEYQRITITGHIDMVPCRLPRKQAKPNGMKRDALCSGFTVTSLGEGEYFGITLDRDHLYLLGDFTITHNTYQLLKMAEHAHEVGHAPLFITTEMGIEQIGRRYAALRLGINPTALKMNTIDTYMERRIRSLQAEMLQDTRFKIFSVGMGARVSSIEALIQEFGPDAVYLDGAYLLHPSVKGKMNRIERVGEVFDELKGLTISAGIPIINTMQFNRQAGKDGKDGSLETIGFTDAVGMHSSVVIRLGFGPTANPRESRANEFLKGREGESGTVYTNFKFAPVDFSEFHYVEGSDEEAANDGGDESIWRA